MESRCDTLHSIPKKLESCTSHSFHLQHKRYLFVHLGVFYIRKIQTFLRSQHNNLNTTKHNNRLLKINRFYMCITYIGLNLVFLVHPILHA